MPTEGSSLGVGGIMGKQYMNWLWWGERRTDGHRSLSSFQPSGGCQMEEGRVQRGPALKSSEPVLVSVGLDLFIKD